MLIQATHYPLDFLSRFLIIVCHYGFSSKPMKFSIETARKGILLLLKFWTTELQGRTSKGTICESKTSNVNSHDAVNERDNMLQILGLLYEPS